MKTSMSSDATACTVRINVELWFPLSPHLVSSLPRQLLEVLVAACRPLRPSGTRLRRLSPRPHPRHHHHGAGDGTGVRGFSGDGLPATAATINSPVEIVVDSGSGSGSAGSTVFVSGLNGTTGGYSIFQINPSGVASAVLLPSPTSTETKSTSTTTKPTPPHLIASDKGQNQQHLRGFLMIGLNP